MISLSAQSANRVRDAGQCSCLLRQDANTIPGFTWIFKELLSATIEI
jgi:hypothetical protein